MPRRPHREIEIKLRVAELSALLRTLAKLGASAEGRVLERNTLYDTPDSYFRRTGRLLRVRIETPAASAAVKAGKGTALITFKAPPGTRRQSRYKEKLESEVALRQSEAWSRALVALGFKPGFQYEKYRSSFRFRGVHVCLDETPIGAFLELEGAPAAIDWVARQLGYSPRDYIRATYWDLYAADCAHHGRSPRNLLFRA
ncbi:MAG: class IV adenylate cyclase [Candidatus Acidiferrales bacterium]